MVFFMSEKGFLQPFEEFIVKRTRTNRLWARSLALSSLATAIGDEVKFRTSIGPLQLNLFYVDIGASGLAKKTLAMQYYSKPTLLKLEELLKMKVLLPEEFTAEGMHEYFLSSDVPSLQGVERKYDVSLSGTIYQDEFSKFIKEVRSKKYMTGLFEFLSELYDGYVKSRFTRTGKYQPGVKVCVNLVAASTPAILPFLQPEFFRLGLGNRILFVSSGSGIVEKEDSERYFLPELEDDRLKHINHFADLLQDYNESVKGRCVIPSPEAGDFLVNYEFLKKSEAKTLFDEDMLSLAYSYIDRLPVFAFKMSALHAIDREGMRPWKDSKDNLIEVRKEDVDWATQNVDEHFKHFKKLLDLWENLERAERTKVRRRDPEDIKSIIAIAGPQGIIMTELRHKAYSKGFTPERFIECLNLIVKSGEVTAQREEIPNQPGPKPMVLRLSIYKKPKWMKSEKQDNATASSS